MTNIFWDQKKIILCFLEEVFDVLSDSSLPSSKRPSLIPLDLLSHPVQLTNLCYSSFSSYVAQVMMSPYKLSLWLRLT